VIQDRESRFIVAHASGRRDQKLVDEAVTKVHARGPTKKRSGAPTADP
jgi:hypothetical protein